jgi:hypothetical protein
MAKDTVVRPRDPVVALSEARAAQWLLDELHGAGKMAGKVRR